MSRAERLAKYSEGLRILALDPSSTACGWAVLDSWPIALDCFGVEKPRGRKCPIDRMRRITAEITALVDQVRPDKIVVEWADGKQHGRIAGRSQGLSTMGQAQGWLCSRLESLDQEVQYVAPNLWTRGTRKEKRALIVRLKFPDYGAWSAKGRDKHMDAADAIGLGEWWLAKHRVNALMRGEDVA
jgi:hypothetical protein